MAVDRQIIKKLLDSLKDELSKIEAMDFTFDELIGKVDIQDLVNRRLQIAVESCIDIAVHLASGLRLPGQDSAADVFRLLTKERIIKEELGEKMAKACGLRNVLVHQYLKIDYKIVHQSSKDGLSILKDFAKAVVDFLEKNPQA